MRCKVGDLAVYVGEWQSLLGSIVTVVEFAGHYGRGPAWWIDPPLTSPGRNRPGLFYDSALRPIRDNDGEDETLTWKQLERV